MKRLLLTAMILCWCLPAQAFDFSIGGTGNILGEAQDKIDRVKRGAEVVKALIPISDEEERILGRAVAAKVIQRYGIENAEKETYYLNLLGNALVRHSDRPNIQYNFAILDTSDVNAYACPGGYIFITRGALNMVKNEAQLAAVLAHEIAHVSERHIVKAMQQSKLLKVGAKVAANAFKRGGRLFEKMTDFALDALFNGLKKSDEYASDKKALVYLNRIGYHYPSLFRVLKKLEKRRKAGKTKVLAKTHPTPTDRLTKAKGSVKRLELDEPTKIRLKKRFVRHTTEEEDEEEEDEESS